jgi:hypothetical protein
MTLSSLPQLPLPRGPLSAAVVDALRWNELEPIRDRALDPEAVDMFVDDDAQLALACCYELSYQSFAEVDDRWEWEPELLAVRGLAEGADNPCCTAHTTASEF